MPLSIRVAPDAPPGLPRPVLLALTCAGAGCRKHDTFDQETYAEQLHAARSSGWQLRVGDDGVTLCRDCRRGWGGQRAVTELAMQGELF